jgi:hypothetical protein
MPAVRSRGDRVVPKAKPRADAYVGVLGVSLLALGVATLFAFLEWNSYEGKPKAVQAPARAPVSGGPGPNVPAVNPQGAGAAGNPQGAGMQGAPPPGGVQGGQPGVPPGGQQPPKK